MRKIPTVFLRDPDDMRNLTRMVHPACQWVLDGEGTPTRKYDGVCIRLDHAGWWARREVKPGKPVPSGYEPVETDPVTGKTVGWQPLAQSPFAVFHNEAVVARAIWPLTTIPAAPGTYELVGPKINRNPEQVPHHTLIRHGYLTVHDDAELGSAGRTYDSLRGWLLAHPEWEGIVWHHPDGRMAKLKRRDFAR